MAAPLPVPEPRDNHRIRTPSRQPHGGCCSAGWRSCRNQPPFSATGRRSRPCPTDRPCAPRREAPAAGLLPPAWSLVLAARGLSGTLRPGPGREGHRVCAVSAVCGGVWRRPDFPGEPQQPRRREGGRGGVVRSLSDPVWKLGWRGPRGFPAAVLLAANPASGLEWEGPSPPAGSLVKKNRKKPLKMNPLKKGDKFLVNNVEK